MCVIDFQQDALVVKLLAGMADWQQSVSLNFQSSEECLYQSTSQQVKNPPTSLNNNHPMPHLALCVKSVFGLLLHGKVRLKFSQKSTTL